MRLVDPPGWSLFIFFVVCAALIEVQAGAATTELAQQAYVKASNSGRGHLFGYSAAVGYDLVVVGAPQEGGDGSGAAYVFVRHGTNWTQQAYLTASDRAAAANFGWSVAVSGGKVVVGAPKESSGGTNSGAAYVFVQDGTNWTQQARLKGSNLGADDRFGESVSISGERLVIGAPGEDSSATGVNNSGSDSSRSVDSGAAYIFERRGNSWVESAYLKASPSLEKSGHRFGQAVGITTDSVLRVIVGAPGESSNARGINGEESNISARRSGAAYVYAHDGTNWFRQAYLKASNADAEDQFGSAVAISGNRIIVGAPFESSNAVGVNDLAQQNDNSKIRSGAAYIFIWTGGEWRQDAYLKASVTGEVVSGQDVFGSSVAVDDNTAVVGAGGEDSNAAGVNGDENNNRGSNSGAAYVFKRRAETGWVQEAYLKPSNNGQNGLGAINDGFGTAVGVFAETVVAGSPQEDSDARGVNQEGQDPSSLFDAGAVYIFHPAAPLATSYFSTPGSGEGIRFYGDIGTYQTRTVLIGNKGTTDLRILGINLVDLPMVSIAWKTFDGRTVTLPHTIPAGSTIDNLQIDLLWYQTVPENFLGALQVLSDDATAPQARYPVSTWADDPYEKSLEATVLDLVLESFGGRTRALSAALPEPRTATLTLAPDGIHKVTAEIPAFLGGGSAQLSNFTGSVTLSLLPIPNDTNRAVIRVESGRFTAPSFRFGNGLESGPNQLTFGEPELSGGMLMLKDGSYTAYASATIVNHLFPDGFRVRGNYSGIYNAQTGQIALSSQSEDSFERNQRLNFSRTSDRLWLTWANTNRLQQTTNILGPWQMVTNSSSPHLVTTTNFQQFYRLAPN